MSAPHDALRHREVFGLSWPIMVSMLSYTAMTVVDSIYVGRLGTAELAAIGISTSVIYLGMSFGNGLTSGVRVHVARETGAGRADRAAAFSWHGVWIALAMGLLVATLAPLGPIAFSMMGASADVAPHASGYYAVRTLGAPVYFGFLALTVAFQGRGDTRTPMVATVAANVLNIVLDPVLIFGWGPVPALGIRGAALATVIGMALGIAILVWPARSLLGAPVAPQRSVLAAIWDVGSPIGTQYLLEVGGFTLFAALLAHAGDAHLAAHVIVVRIIMVAFLPCHAIGEAVGVLVGQSLGAGCPSRARDALRLGTVQAVALMVALGVVYVAIPDALTGAFGATEDVRAIARRVLLLYATFQVVDALATVAFGALGGAGDTRFVMRVSVLSSWLLKLPVACVLVVGFDLGALGAWLGIAAEVGVLAVIGRLRVRGTAWLERREPEPSGVTAAA